MKESERSIDHHSNHDVKTEHRIDEVSDVFQENELRLDSNLLSILTI